MKIKNISILTAVLAVIAGVLWIAQRSNTPSIDTALVGQGLLIPGSIADAQTIKIYGNSEDEPSVEIIKQGDNWIVPERYGLPVDFTKVSDLVNDLAESTIIRAVTDNPDRIQVLNLGQDRVVFEDASGEILADVSFGKAGNNGGNFAKIERSEKVVLAADKPFIQSRPDTWTVSEAWELEWDDIRELVAPDGTTLTREDSEAEFVAEGLDLEQSEIRTQFMRFTNLRFQDLVEIDSEDVVEAMSFAQTWEIKTEAGDTFAFTYGRRPEVKAPEKEESEESEETTEEEESAETEEVEDMPAGTPYIMVKHDNASELWAGIYATYAFELNSFNFEQLPESMEAFVAEPEPEESEEDAEATEEVAAEDAE